MRIAKIAIAAVLALSASSPAPVVFAADKEPAKADDGYVSLFDGQSLKGWVVTECKAEAKDGKLVILEGEGFIRSEKIYGDFVLELDWKNLQAEKYDSGIYIRADLPRKNNHWPDRYQVNLAQGKEGDLVASKVAKSTGLAKGGEWNHFKITCVGGKCELEINGKPAWKTEEIKPTQGYVGIQCEATKGGQFEFKNIRIKPLTPPVDAPAAPAETK